MSVSSFIKNLFGLNVEAKYFILKTKDLITILKVSPLDSALTVETFYTLTISDVIAPVYLVSFLLRHGRISVGPTSFVSVVIICVLLSRDPAAR